MTNTLYDFTASVTPIDALTLGLNADFNSAEVAGPSTSTDDFGVAVYANFKLTPKARLASRGEYLSLDRGATGYDYLNEVTSTFGYSPLTGVGPTAEWRPGSRGLPHQAPGPPGSGAPS